MHRLALDDLDWATDLLTAAFLQQPPADTLFQGARHAELTRYFMRCTCKYTLLYGEGYANAERTAVALWLNPGRTSLRLDRMARAGMLAAPWRMGRAAFKRFGAFASHTAAMHARAVPGPHYYLFALGVVPGAQGRGAGRGLLAPMLARIDAERMPAYLETQCARNVPLYQRLGFEVHAQAAFPGLDGLCNWAMARPAADLGPA